MAFQWSNDLIRKLIQIVRANFHLYDKNNKLFKDTKAKSLTWDTIAKNISIECAGEEACRKFKSLRDIFRKEYRKIKDCVGRSGDGEDSTSQYNSSWEFYPELLFLVEHITKRSSKKSVSNIVRKNTSLIIPKRPLFTQAESERPVTSVPENSTSEIKSLTIEIDSASSQELTSCQGNSELNLGEVIFSPDITDNELETITSVSDVSTPSQTFSESPVSFIRQKAINSLKVPTPDWG